MEFINTDGMAFFGPGSEWFWTMLQFIALSITFVAIYRQLRAQHVHTRENAKLLRSQAHHNALMLLDRPWEMQIENEGLSEIIVVGAATPDALSKAEWGRFFAYHAMQFNGWEYAYYEDLDRSIPRELWLGTDSYFRGVLPTNPGIARVWSQSRHQFEDPFRSHVDHIIATATVPEQSQHDTLVAG